MACKRDTFTIIKGGAEEFDDFRFSFSHGMYEKMRALLTSLLKQNDAILVTMVIWTARHRALVVEAFFKSGDSVIKTQGLFRREFTVPCHGAVPRPNTIKLILIPYSSNTMGARPHTARAT